MVRGAGLVLRLETQAPDPKGYRGNADVFDEDGVFHGRILGIEDVVTFEATTVDELEKAFRDSVDDYLAFCEEIGKKPDREYSGTLSLRMPPEPRR